MVLCLDPFCVCFGLHSQHRLAVGVGANKDLFCHDISQWQASGTVLATQVVSYTGKKARVVCIDHA